MDVNAFLDRIASGCCLRQLRALAEAQYIALFVVSSVESQIATQVRLQYSHNYDKLKEKSITLAVSRLSLHVKLCFAKRCQTSLFV